MIVCDEPEAQLVVGKDGVVSFPSSTLQSVRMHSSPVMIKLRTIARKTGLTQVLIKLRGHVDYEARFGKAMLDAINPGRSSGTLVPMLASTRRSSPSGQGTPVR